MNHKGFEQLNRIFEGANIDAEVCPEPPEDADLHYITVRTLNPMTAPAHVLNALRHAGVLIDSGPQQDFIESPCLEPVSVQEGSITFQDKAVWPGDRA